jgi:hypothetical protein
MPSYWPSSKSFIHRTLVLINLEQIGLTQSQKQNWVRSVITAIVISNTSFGVFHRRFKGRWAISGLQRLSISSLLCYAIHALHYRIQRRVPLCKRVSTPPLVSEAPPKRTPCALAGFWCLVISPPSTRIGAPNGHRMSIRKLNLEPFTISWRVRGVVWILGIWLHCCTASWAN